MANVHVAMGKSRGWAFVSQEYASLSPVEFLGFKCSRNLGFLMYAIGINIYDGSFITLKIK